MDFVDNERIFAKGVRGFLGVKYPPSQETVLLGKAAFTLHKLLKARIDAGAEIRHTNP